jgi:hypothetical protein
MDITTAILYFAADVLEVVALLSSGVSSALVVALAKPRAMGSQHKDAKSTIQLLIEKRIDTKANSTNSHGDGPPTS